MRSIFVCVSGERSLTGSDYRFIKIANETMCRPIRALTEARGYATSNHMWVVPFSLLDASNVIKPSLASFGGAGGQHACEIAQILGIETVLIHRYSSILSAYGLALADRSVLILYTYTLSSFDYTFHKGLLNAKNRPPLLSRRTFPYSFVPVSTLSKRRCDRS